tara:strand:- start:1013 stop:1228 length:216 start_codon:yes stop_codon:yes gene_type:complete
MSNKDTISKCIVPSKEPAAPNVHQKDLALTARRHMEKASKECLIQIYRLRAEKEIPLFDKTFLDHNHTLMG